MENAEHFLFEHRELTRRYFMRMGVTGAAVLAFWPLAAGDDPPTTALAKAIKDLEPYFTPQEKFRDVSRGKPLPHSLPDKKKREAGLTRETWKLEVSSDPNNPAKIRSPLTQKFALLVCISTSISSLPTASEYRRADNRARPRNWIPPL